MLHFNTVAGMALAVALLSLSAGCSKSPRDEASRAGTGHAADDSATTVTPQIDTASPSSAATTFETIEWTDLMPAEDLQALLEPPAYLDEIEDGSEADQIGNQMRTEASQEFLDRYQQALTSTRVHEEYNNRNIRIPGFIVPLDFNDDQTITTFFLVPFFGACIHLPPPPPNQIIYAKFDAGIKLEALYDPFWIEGTLSTTLVENELATAAYSMTVRRISEYDEPEEE